MEKKVLVLYIKEYLKKYSGRGLPVALDPVLAARVRGQASADQGGSKEDVKAMRLRVDALASTTSDLSRAVAQLRR